MLVDLRVVIRIILKKQRTAKHARATTHVIIADLLIPEIKNKMKKQTKKLSLNKTTISNLSATELSRQMGGSYCITRTGTSCYSHFTCKGKTCNRHCF